MRRFGGNRQNGLRSWQWSVAVREGGEEANARADRSAEVRQDDGEARVVMLVALVGLAGGQSSGGADAVGHGG